jgi:hypothetical protein
LEFFTQRRQSQSCHHPSSDRCMSALVMMV